MSFESTLLLLLPWGTSSQMQRPNPVVHDRVSTSVWDSVSGIRTTHWALALSHILQPLSVTNKGLI